MMGILGPYSPSGGATPPIFMYAVPTKLLQFIYPLLRKNHYVLFGKFLKRNERCNYFSTVNSWRAAAAIFEFS